MQDLLTKLKQMCDDEEMMFYYTCGAYYNDCKDQRLPPIDQFVIKVRKLIEEHDSACKTLDERLIQLDNAVGTVSKVTVKRCYDGVDKFKWRVTLGEFTLPQMDYVGESLDEVLSQIERDYIQDELPPEN